MLDPDYLLHAVEPAEEIAEQLHKDILDRIIERILLRFKRGDEYTLTAIDKWQIETLQDAGFLLDDIQKEIAKATGLMQSEVAQAMEDAGVRAMEYDDAVYRAAGLDPLPLVQSPHLISIMQRDYEAAMGDWKNFTRTTADAIQQTFIRLCDNAYNQAISGAISPSQAVLEALEEIVEDGVYVDYTKFNEDGTLKSVHRDTIETATARAVRTGISQASGHITDARMEEMEWDIILVSSHIGARVNEKQDYTNHYWWQGKFYSKSGTDTRFPPYSVCGFGDVQGIHGANCRHSHGPGDGKHNPFQEFDSEENRKKYQLEQQQRAMERRIRDTKRKAMGWRTAMEKETDPAMKAEYEARYQKKAALLQKQNKAYDDFCKETGQKKRYERLKIAKWDRSQAAKATAAAKKYAADHPDSVVPKPYSPKQKRVQATHNPFSIEERKKKMSLARATSIGEATEIAKSMGVRYPRFEKMDIEQVNNMLNAVDTLPEDCKPAMIANGKDISTATGRPLGRKADQWWGVTYDYRDFSLRTMQLGYDKTDYDGGQLVGFNTTKYKTLEALTKAKVSNNEKYFSKTGRYWSFNTDGRATAYHEFGHCFVNVKGLPQNWETISMKWAEESKCDILRKPDEAFAEAWAAFWMADDRLPEYISDSILKAIGG